MEDLEHLARNPEMCTWAPPASKTKLWGKSLYVDMEDMGHLARNPEMGTWIPQSSKLSF